jgi:hypothetical protein
MVLFGLFFSSVDFCTECSILLVIFFVEELREELIDELHGGGRLHLEQGIGDSDVQLMHLRVDV